MMSRMAFADDATRLALEERLRFEALLADLSSQFINIAVNEIDAAIDDALGRFGDQFDIDRAALSEISEGSATLVVRHSWTRDGVEPSPSKIDAGSVYPYGLGKVLNGEVHAFASIDELPAGIPDRDYLARVGVKSAVAVPLVATGRVFGAFSFSVTRHLRHWDPGILARVGLIGDLFANAMLRKRADEALRQAQDERLRFENLVADLASQFVSIESDRVDDAIRDAQRRLVEALGVDRTSFFYFDTEGLPILTHTWSRPGIPPVPRLTAETVVEMFPWVLGRVREGQTVCFDRVEAIPEGVPDRESFERLGQKAFVGIPLQVTGRVVGVLTLGGLRDPPVWPPDNLDRLSQTGEAHAGRVGGDEAAHRHRRQTLRRAQIARGRASDRSASPRAPEWGRLS
jgi:GAF domain-containing protein